MIDSNIQWPTVFMSGVVPSDRSNPALVADGLVAWANCMTGERPTKHFGVVMQAIGERLGITPLPEVLMAWRGEST